jgi:arylsulfatase A-like enzyme
MMTLAKYLACFFLVLFCLPVVKAAERLNVVIITADAMRGDMMGVNNHPEVKTPRLDALAAEGINFSRAYCNITTTTPSHASIFSSLYPFEHKAYSNTARIDSAILTLPEILKQQGWHTAGIVNMPWLNPEVSNVPQGIDEFAKCKRIRKADKTNKWVMKFLDSRKSKEQPFFLWIHYVDTHTPYHAPKKFERMYYPKGKNPRAGKSGSLQKAWKLFPAHNRDNEFFKKWLKGITDVDYVVASNKGSVSWLDQRVGDLIDRLKANGQWDNTLFIFTSDHGESLGEHGIYFGHSGLYEATARVPLIVRLPGGPQAKNVNTIVQLTDIMPTVLARLDLDIPKAVRGQDLWQTLSASSFSGGTALLEHAGRQLSGVVTSRYKYIKHLKTRDIHPSYPMRKGHEELYDLAADPQEQNNLAASQPDILREMRMIWKKLRNPKKSTQTHANQQADIDANTEEMLRSLGYTQ